MLTKERLEELFEYRDGKLYWRVRNPRSRMKVGDRAGALASKGYWRVMVDKKSYLEHRLVWLLHHGQLPESLDHVNGDKLDNCIENLRECTTSQNNRNCRVRKNKLSSLPKGVYYDKRYDSYAVQVRLHKVAHYGGSYKTIEEADAAVRALREKLHGEFARHE